MALVYISSTYQDLRDHRTGVHEAVKRLHHVPIGMEDYQASEKRPLDRCLEDVRRCRAYIGVIAWRYGFIPRGQRDSITSLEYQEAGRHSIPRLMFLSPDSDWPATLRDANNQRITGFRDELRQRHICDTFESVKDLQYKVAASLKHELGDGIAIPPLLPFRCDREDQYSDLTTAMDARRAAGATDHSVTVAFASGMEPQALNKFVQCVQADATTLLGAHPENPCAWFDVPWPTDASAASIQGAFLRTLARRLSASEPTPAGIAARLRALNAPTIIHSRVFTDRWSMESELALHAIVSACRELQVPSHHGAVVVLLSIDYREPQGLLGRYGTVKRNRQVQDALAGIGSHWKDCPHVVIARELRDVERFHAETWADGEAVQELVQGADMRTDIGKIFTALQAQPMRPLAAKLRSLLEWKISESRR